jgi:hypothetical protein
MRKLVGGAEQELQRTPKEVDPIEAGLTGGS